MIIDQESAIDLLRGVTISMEPQLTRDDVEYIWESIEAGEWGMAYEDLCTQLDERGAKIDSQAYADLKELGEYYRLPPATWEFLCPDNSSPRSAG